MEKLRRWHVALAANALGAAVEVGCGERPEPYAPEVEIGLYGDDGEYSPLVPRDPLRVITGVQAGAWLMPTVRARGLESEAVLECSARLETGEKLVDTFVAREFEPVQASGWREVRAFAMQLDVPIGWSEADLYDRLARLRCKVTSAADPATSAEAAVDVVLVGE